MKIYIFFINKIFFGNFQVVKKEFVGFMIDYIGNRLYCYFIFYSFFNINYENRYFFGFMFYICKWSSLN